MPVRKARESRPGSNLFSIDHVAIKNILREANAELIARCSQLLAALERMPDPLTQPSEIDKANIFSRQIAEALHEIRSARLSDGKPFAYAKKIVEEFFKAIEGPLKKAEFVVRQRRTEAAQRLRPASTPSAGRKAVAQDQAGNAVIEIEPSPVPKSVPPDVSQIQMIWEVTGFDRSLLSLEALRPFLTDHAILSACRRHLEENGPHTLKGVRYAEMAAKG